MDVVVLDTSPLLDDRKLSKPTTRGLLEAAQREEIRVVVPSVVVDEVVNAATGSFVNAGKAYRKAEEILGHHFADRPTAVELDIDALAKDFREGLVRRLKDHSVEIWDVTTASIQDLIDRDLLHRKPFDESGRGFRDALIWYALAEIESLDEVENVTFVTKNTKDFADPNDKARPHPSLLSDLLNPEGVRLVSDLGELFRNVGTLREDLGTAIEGLIWDDPHRFAWLALQHVRVPLPTGESEVISAQILDVNVDDAFYEWGAASAVVRAEIEYGFSGIADEWQLEELDAWPHHAQVDEWMEDSHSAAVSGEGVVRVELSVALDPGEATLDIVEGGLLLEQADGFRPAG